MATLASRSKNFIDVVRGGVDEKGCSTLSLRYHCVLAASMEFSLRPYHTYATTEVRSSHVGEDHTTLLTGSVGAYHVHAGS